MNEATFGQMLIIIQMHFNIYLSTFQMKSYFYYVDMIHLYLVWLRAAIIRASAFLHIVAFAYVTKIQHFRNGIWWYLYVILLVAPDDDNNSQLH